MARGRKAPGPLSLWRPNRTIRNFLALHSLRYRTNKVGGVEVYSNTEILCEFGSQMTHDRVLSVLTAVMSVNRLPDGAKSQTVKYWYDETTKQLKVDIEAALTGVSSPRGFKP